jgi:hypothetical protein
MIFSMPSASAQTRRTTARADVRSLLNGMAEMDFQAVKLDLDRYQVVQLDRVMDTGRIGRLTELVDDNSTARRNRNLVTNLLRQERRVSSAQTVVGADLTRRRFYVVDNRRINDPERNDPFR